jgi:hypothetical protein
MDTSVCYLECNLPRGPHLDSIFQALHVADPLWPPRPQNTVQPAPDRPLPSIMLPTVPWQEAPPTAVVQLQQPTPLAPHNTNLLTPPTTPHSWGPPPATPGSQTSPQCWYQPCSLCGRMGHLPTQCQHYYCHYCETSSPGHFAKFCPRNPHAGLEHRDLPPSVLEAIDCAQRTGCMDLPSSIRSASLPNESIPGPSGLQPWLTPIQSSDHNVNLEWSSALTTTSLGPTYCPVYTALQTPCPAHQSSNFGCLQTSIIAPNCHPRWNPQQHTPHLTPPTYQHATQQPSLPINDDGNYKFDYDNVALYNIVGEGWIDWTFSLLDSSTSISIVIWGHLT